MDIKETIRQLAIDEWGSINLRRLPKKPGGVRIKCKCGNEHGMLSYPIEFNIGEINIIIRIEILMAMCSWCHYINYWADWPDIDETLDRERKSLQNICDHALEILQQ